MISLNNNELPLVTVFTLIYNTNPEFVIQAIESIRAQTYPNIQHIIIDDFSTKADSREAVRQWVFDNKYDCLFVEHKQNYGLCRTLNHVIELAKGEYIVGCSDDLLLENTLEKQIEFILKYNIRIAFCSVELFGNIEKKEIRPAGAFVKGFNSLSNFDQFGLVCQANFIPAIGVVVSKSIFKDYGLYDENLRFEDYDLWLRVLRREKIMFNDMLLARYRVHELSLSSVFRDWDSDYLHIYSKHLDFSDCAKSKIEAIAISAYRNNRTDILEKVFLHKAYSFRLRLLYAFCKLKVPVWLGYRILWRL
jgi:GT2 family glycosyltransferase